MHISVLKTTVWERRAEVSHTDVSGSVMQLPVLTVFSGSCGPVLAQTWCKGCWCFWLCSACAFGWSGVCAVLWSEA